MAPNSSPGSEGFVSAGAPSVSVLVPVFNGEQYLREALDSALDEVEPGDEILVADDASEDSSSEILDEYRGQVSCVRRDEHVGLSHNHNLLLRTARGNYVTFLHQDDTLVPGSLRARREVLDAHPGLGLVSGDALFVDGNGGLLGPPQTPKLPRANELRGADRSQSDRVRIRALTETVQRNPVQLGSVMMRASHVATVGPLWELLGMAVDYDYWLRSLLVSPLVHVPSPVLRFRVHAGQTSQTYRENPGMAQWEIYLALTHARDEARRLSARIPAGLLARWDSMTLLRGAASRLPRSLLRSMPRPVARAWGDLFGM